MTAPESVSVVDAPIASPNTPVPQKKLSLREVARRFETGAGLEDYRTINLNETSEQLLQQTLRTMPGGQRLMKDLVKVVQDLQGRVAGRNSDDAAHIKQGLVELQEQWRAYEKSTKQAAKELTESAAAKQTVGMQHEVQQEERCKARIAELEAEVACLHSQVVERDATIRHLQHVIGSRTTSECLEQKENCSPMRNSSEFGSSDHLSALSSPMSRRSPTRWPSMTAVSEDLTSAELRSLAISGSPSVGQTLQLTSSGKLPVDGLALQWFRSSDGAAPAAISGAVRPQYSPEPADIGCVIMCRACTPLNPGCIITLSTSPVTVDRGFEEEASRLAAAGEASFVVVPVQHNGAVQRSRTVATLTVNRHEVSLRVDGIHFASSPFHLGMQVCGARGGGDGAAQGMFLALTVQHVFMLAMESPRNRNICILLIRKTHVAVAAQLAAKHGLTLEGPQDN